VQQALLRQRQQPKVRPQFSVPTGTRHQAQGSFDEPARRDQAPRQADQVREFRPAVSEFWTLFTIFILTNDFSVLRQLL
jgi:hypothetical protein